tara:strand:- start:5938 stop:7818 length:1881 start_codon:yes stop_codon:yes gene_type:complete
MADLVKKDVKYLNKDFAQFRRNLINFTKTYFPNTYNDFNESSPGMMFLEMSAYVGDVLSFYTDAQAKESLLTKAEERYNLYQLAAMNGYKPKTFTPALVKLDTYQLVPAIGTGTNARPDMKYALTVKSNATVKTEAGQTFRTLDSVDFKFTSSVSTTDVTVYELDDSGNVTYYLLKKQVDAVSGEIKEVSYSFTDPKIYDKIVLSKDDANVLEIIDVRDDNNRKWYEVDYLAQDTIMDPIRNIPFNDPELSQHEGTVPYILKLQKTARRFVTRLREDNRTEIQFGAGISSDADEEIIPNPKNVGMGLNYLKRDVDSSLDPTNFLYTSTYGLAPSDATLTVKYSIGGGVKDNVSANTITVKDSVEFEDVTEELESTVLTQAKNSVQFNNPSPAGGGKAANDLESIRQDAMANFAAQNRSITKEDYIVRCYAMPAKFGSIAKAYILQDNQIDTSDPNNRIPNPLALNLYTLGYNFNKNFIAPNDAIKENLKTYLSQFRMMTDAVNIKSAFIINIGVEFEIVVRPNYNANEVVLRCIDYIKTRFDNDKMQINEPVMLSNLYSEMDRVEGVQSVTDIEITNKYDTKEGYSGHVYDIEAATKNRIIYPSLDPCIFEIKYPNKDIKGRTVTF